MAKAKNSSMLFCLFTLMRKTMEQSSGISSTLSKWFWVRRNKCERTSQKLTWFCSQLFYRFHHVYSRPLFNCETLKRCKNSGYQAKCFRVLEFVCSMLTDGDVCTPRIYECIKFLRFCPLLTDFNLKLSRKRHSHSHVCWECKKKANQQENERYINKCSAQQDVSMFLFRWHCHCAFVPGLDPIFRSFSQFFSFVCSPIFSSFDYLFYALQKTQ